MALMLHSVNNMYIVQNITPNFRKQNNTAKLLCRRSTKTENVHILLM